MDVLLVAVGLGAAVHLHVIWRRRLSGPAGNQQECVPQCPRDARRFAQSHPLDRPECGRLNCNAVVTAGAPADLPHAPDDEVGRRARGRMGLLSVDEDTHTSLQPF